MKRSLLIITTIAAASPALAHTDSSFHTHGAESFLVLAAIAVSAAIFAFKR